MSIYCNTQNIIIYFCSIDMSYEKKLKTIYNYISQECIDKNVR